MSESNMSISEMLTYSTVLINCQYADGSVGSGTGFFSILFLRFEVQIRCKLDQNRGMGPVERRRKPLKTLRKLELGAFHRVQTPERSVPLSPVTNP